MSRIQMSYRPIVNRLGVLATLGAIFLLFAAGASAQEIVWSENSQRPVAIAKHKSVVRRSFPSEFKLFDLNSEPLRQQLFSVIGDSGRMQSVVIPIPNADGGIELFEVYEASNFDPELQARFPEIRAFSGRGITDPYATLKLSFTPQGVSGTVFRNASDFFQPASENEFIEAYSADRGTYAVFRSESKSGEIPWACTTEEELLFSDWKSQINSSNVIQSSSGEIRTLRLVQSVNGEYSNFFGATTAGTPADQALTAAAINATLTRSNGVYEKDLGVHLNLIAQTTLVCFCNPATDPYTTSISAWNNQLRDAIIAAGIGIGAYDIGHMFGASGG